MKRAPVEPKVQAAGLAGTAAGVIIWVLQAYAFSGAVPAGLVSLIYAAVPGLLAFVAGYLVPHQSRPSDTPVITFNRPIEPPVKPPAV